MTIDEKSLDENPRRAARSKRRSVRVGEIIEFLEYLAPPAMTAPAAPFGLQVGSRQSILRTIVVSPVPTHNAIRKATETKAGLLICAMPLLTHPFTALCWDDPVGAKITQLTQRQVSLYALSNAYAAAPAGFDDCLAERLGLAARGALVPTLAEKQLKLVVFVPPSALDRVRNAAGDAGAGLIGTYSHCGFSMRGSGTFLPLPGATPTVGRVGKRETVDETRLEMVVPERELQGVIAAVLEAHPYEAVAYDVYPLHNPGMVYGRGRIGELPLHVSLDTILAQTSDALGLEGNAARCTNRMDALVGTLAVASGVDTGEGLLWAAHRQQAGALIVGGLSMTDTLLADSTHTTVIDIGFAPSVAPGLERLTAQLQDTFRGDGLRVVYNP